MEQIINVLENICISENSNNNNNSSGNNMEQQKRFVMDNLKLIHPFSGQKEALSMYIGAIESVIPVITTLPPGDRTLLFNCILRTLDGAALEVVRREQPEDWTALKSSLIAEFGESLPITQLVLSINNIKFKGSVRKLCNEISSAICRVNDAIKLCNETVERKNFLKNETNFSGLRVLKKELPNHLVALLNANLTNDFKTAVKVLKENNELEPDYIKPESTRLPQSNSPRYYPQLVRNEYRTVVASNGTHLNPTSRNNLNYAAGNPGNFYYGNRNPNHSGGYRVYNSGNYNTEQSRNNNKNRSFNNINNNLHPHKRARENDSLQSRIRRYGPAAPMEVENFHSMASNSFPPS